MADRYQEERMRRERQQRGGYGRQAEQFQSEYGSDEDRNYGQMGDSSRGQYGQQETGWQSDGAFGREERFGRERNFSTGGDYRQSGQRFGTSPYGTTSRPDYDRYTGSEFQSREGTTPRRAAEEAREAFAYGAGSRLAASHGEWHDPDNPYGQTGRSSARHTSGSDRGFLDRASETVAGWFGDDHDGGGREHHRGRGPANYTRSDERILEDACEQLTQDWRVDARNIQVTVQSGEVTLDGTVASREEKRRAEDVVDNLSGVKHVQNNLRVQQGSTWDRNNSGDTTTTSPSNPTSSQG